MKYAENTIYTSYILTVSDAHLSLSPFRLISINSQLLIELDTLSKSQKISLLNGLESNLYKRK